jgi:hypothetical protein
MPAHTPGCAFAVLEVDQEKFLMTFPCTLVAVLFPTRSQMPTKVYACVVPVLVQAENTASRLITPSSSAAW